MTSLDAHRALNEVLADLRKLVDQAVAPFDSELFSEYQGYLHGLQAAVRVVEARISQNKAG